MPLPPPKPDDGTDEEIRRACFVFGWHPPRVTREEWAALAELRRVSDEARAALARVRDLPAPRRRRSLKPHAAARCAHIVDGARCGNWRVHGGAYCWHHRRLAPDHERLGC